MMIKNEIFNRIEEKFNTETFFNIFNFIRECGFPKGSTHFILIDFFTYLGNWANYVGASEVPIIDKEYALMTYRTHAKSPDLIWYDKFKGIPKVLFEVQRYEKKKKRKNLEIDSFYDKILNLFIVRNDLKQKFPINYSKMLYVLIEVFNRLDEYNSINNSTYCDLPNDFFNKGICDENNTIFSPITYNTDEVFIFVKVLLKKQKINEIEFLEKIKVDLYVKEGKYSSF